MEFVDRGDSITLGALEISAGLHDVDEGVRADAEPLLRQGERFARGLGVLSLDLNGLIRGNQVSIAARDFLRDAELLRADGVLGVVARGFRLLRALLALEAVEDRNRQ